jgi:type VII secretion system ESX-1 substrate
VSSFQDAINNIQDTNMAADEAGSYPALGFNPTPGNVGTVSSLASNFLNVSSHLQQARDAMVKAGQVGGFWEGDAANAFHNDLGKLPDYLDKATQSLGEAGRALDGWSNDLTSMQSTASDYEQQAENAIREVNQAKSNPDLQLAGQEFDTQEALQQAQQRLNAAESDLNQAQGDLNAIREQAKRLFSQHQDLVKQVEDALNKAKDEAPDKPGFWSSVGSAFSSAFHGLEDLAKNTWDFVKKHANVIAKVGDVLSMVGTALSIAAAATAEIPIVGEVVEGVSIGVNASALGAHALAKAAGANVSNATLAQDAIGLIPGGAMLKGATKAGNVVKVAKAAGKAFQAADDGARIAKAGEAAGKTLADLSKTQFTKWTNAAEKISKVVPGLTDKIAGSKVASTVAGTVVGAVQNTAIKVGMWQVQPYLGNAADAAKNAASSVLHGNGLPSAGQVFNQVAHGSTG